MKYDCEVVQDLLPLYQDGICSDTSRKIVDEHLKDCEKCNEIAKKMGDSTVEKQFIRERESVVKAHQRHENRRMTTVGIATAGILMIPVLICLICNIVIGHALDWFFIVLTAMLLVAAILVVPLVVPEKKLFWTILGATGALLALLLTCCIYTGGDWFLLVAVSCIFGISLLVAPYVVKNIPLPQKLRNHKACIVVFWDSFWLYLLLTVCGCYVRGGNIYWRTSMTVTTYILCIIWIWLIVLRYLKRSGWTKAGILIMATGIWFGITNNVMNFFLPFPDGDGLENLDLRQGFRTEDLAVFNANVLFTIIVLSVWIGIICILIGHRKRRKHTDEKNS